MSATEIGAGVVRATIQELCDRGESGLLTLQRDGRRCDLCFQSGQLVFASSNLKRFQPLEWLERAGWTEAMALEAPAGGTKSIVDDLVGLGCDRVKLVTDMRARLLEIVGDTLGWTSGTQDFAPGKPVLAQEVLLDGSTRELLVEIEQQRANTAATAAIASGADNAAAITAAGGPRTTGTGSPTSPSAKGNPRGAAAGTSESPFGASGARSPSATGTATGSPPSTESPFAAGSAAGSPPTTDAPAMTDDRGDPDIERLRRHFQAAGGMNHYEILGVARSADKDAIRQSFYGLARDYHPDSVNQRVAGLCRSDVEEYFSRVTEAYTVLSRREERAEYDEHLKVGKRTTQRPDQDNVRLARESYEKGKRLAAAGKLHDAFQFFRTAIDMDGGHFEYHRDLGILQMKNPRWQKAAEESLLKATELRPGDAETLVQLGLLYKKNRMKRRAEETFRQALEWDPDNTIAQEELGSGKESPGGGGLKGLFSRG